MAGTRPPPRSPPIRNRRLRALTKRLALLGLLSLTISIALSVHFGKMPNPLPWKPNTSPPAPTTTSRALAAIEDPIELALARAEQAETSGTSAASLLSKHPIHLLQLLPSKQNAGSSSLLSWDGLSKAFSGLWNSEPEPIQLQSQSAITLVFSRAVIALASDWPQVATPPMLFDPPVSGNWRWVTTSIARFDPDDSWPSDLTFTATPNIQSGAHGESIQWGLEAQTFKTQPLALQSTVVTSHLASEYSGGTWASRQPYQASKTPLYELPHDAEVTWRFSQPIVTSLFAKRVFLQTRSGTKAPNAISVAPCDSSLGEHAPTTCIRLSLSDPLKPRQRGALVLPSGYRYHPEAGPALSPISIDVMGLKPNVIAFNKGLLVDSRKLSLLFPYGLADGLTLQDLAPAFSLTTAGSPVNITLSWIKDQSSLRIHAPSLQANTEYLLKVRNGATTLKDRFGQILEPSSVTFNTYPVREEIDLLSRAGTLELSSANPDQQWRMWYRPPEPRVNSWYYDYGKPEKKFFLPARHVLLPVTTDPFDLSWLRYQNLNNQQLLKSLLNDHQSSLLTVDLDHTEFTEHSWSLDQLGPYGLALETIGRPDVNEMGKHGKSSEMVYSHPSVIWITDLAFFVEPLPKQQLAIFIVDTATGLPVPKARVQFYENGALASDTLPDVFTDDDGLVLAPKHVKTRSRWSFVASAVLPASADRQERLHLVKGTLPTWDRSSTSDKAQISIALDRTLVRPGETLKITGVSRTWNHEDGLWYPESGALSAAVQGQWDPSAESLPVPVNWVHGESGVWDVEIDVPQNALPGSWRILLSGEMGRAQTSVIVADPRPPVAELKWSHVANDSEPLMTPFTHSCLTTEVETVTYTGTPIPEAHITVSWSLNRPSFCYWCPPEEAAEDDGSLITSGMDVLTTGLDGRLEWEFCLPENARLPDMGDSISFDVSYVGPTREVITASSSVPFGWAHEDWIVQVPSHIPGVPFVPRLKDPSPALLGHKSDVVLSSQLFAPTPSCDQEGPLPGLIWSEEGLVTPDPQFWTPLNSEGSACSKTIDPTDLNSSPLLCPTGSFLKLPQTGRHILVTKLSSDDSHSSKAVHKVFALGLRESLWEHRPLKSLGNPASVVSFSSPVARTGDNVTAIVSWPPGSLKAPPEAVFVVVGNKGASQVRVIRDFRIEDLGAVGQQLQLQFLAGPECVGGCDVRIMGVTPRSGRPRQAGAQSFELDGNGHQIRAVPEDWADQALPGLPVSPELDIHAPIAFSVSGSLSWAPSDERASAPLELTASLMNQNGEEVDVAEPGDQITISVQVSEPNALIHVALVDQALLDLAPTPVTDNSWETLGSHSHARRMNTGYRSQQTPFSLALSDYIGAGLKEWYERWTWQDSGNSYPETYLGPQAMLESDAALTDMSWTNFYRGWTNRSMRRGGDLEVVELSAPRSATKSVDSMAAGNAMPMMAMDAAPEVGGGGSPPAPAVSMTLRGDSVAVGFSESVVVSADGSWTKQITLPDNVGKWELRVWGCDSTPGRAGRTATATQPLVTRRRVNISPSLPRLVRIGDEFMAGVVVTPSPGYDQDPVRVDLKLKDGTGVEMLDSAAPDALVDLLKLGAGGPVEIVWPMKVVRLGDAVFESSVASTTAPSSGVVLDALGSMDLPTLNAQLPVTVATSLAVSAGDKALQGLHLAFPSVPDSKSLRVMLSVGHLAAVEATLNAINASIGAVEPDDWTVKGRVPLSLMASFSASDPIQELYKIPTFGSEYAGSIKTALNALKERNGVLGSCHATTRLAYLMSLHGARQEESELFNKAISNALPNCLIRDSVVSTMRALSQPSFVVDAPRVNHLTRAVAHAVLPESWADIITAKALSSVWSSVLKDSPHFRRLGVPSSPPTWLLPAVKKVVAFQTAFDDVDDNESVFVAAVVAKAALDSSQITNTDWHDLFDPLFLNRIRVQGRTAYMIPYKSATWAAQLIAQSAWLDVFSDPRARGTAAENPLIEKLAEWVSSECLRRTKSLGWDSAFAMAALASFDHFSGSTTPNLRVDVSALDIDQELIPGTTIVEATFSDTSQERVVSTDIAVRELEEKAAVDSVGISAEGKGLASVVLALEWEPLEISKEDIYRGLFVERTIRGPGVRWDGDVLEVELGTQVEVIVSVTSLDQLPGPVKVSEWLPGGLEPMEMIPGTENVFDGLYPGWSKLYMPTRRIYPDKVVWDLPYLGISSRTMSYKAIAATRGTFVLPPTHAILEEQPELAGLSGGGILRVVESSPAPSLHIASQ